MYCVQIHVCITLKAKGERKKICLLIKEVFIDVGEHICLPNLKYL